MEQIKPFHATFHLDQQVTEVQRQEDGSFRVVTSAGTEILAKAVVIAGGVGSFQPMPLKVDNIDQAIRFINDRPKPLALYLFSSDQASYDAVVERTSSGGMVHNHTLLHFAVPSLPFGGVGDSGMGAYHGRESFDTFSHRKAVLKKPVGMDAPIQYPPYTDSKKTWLRRLL